jgi:hypothetical protein
MNDGNLEQILKSHLRGVHAELATLFTGVEKALDMHLAKTETLISQAIQDHQKENETRIAALELRVQSLESRV